MATKEQTATNIVVSRWLRMFGTLFRYLQEATEIQDVIVQSSVSDITDKLTKLKGMLMDEDHQMDSGAFLEAVSKKH